MIYVQQASSTSSGALLDFTFNADTGSKYDAAGVKIFVGSSYTASNFGGDEVQGTTSIPFGLMGASAAAKVNGYLLIQGCSSTNPKPYTLVGGGDPTSSSSQSYWYGGIFNNTSAISSVQIRVDAGTFDNGKIFIYGSAV